MLGRRGEDRRSGSVTRDTRQRLTDQISLQEERINISRGRSPSLLPSRRWSTILCPDTKTGGRAGARVLLSRPPSCPPTSSPTSRPPTRSAYSAALVRQSHRLRDRSVSPSAGQTCLTEKPQIYRTNSDYYRGKVKSVYEKDPLFKDFMRNLPLTESNLTEDVNLSSLKKRFHNLVQSRRGAENHLDPIFGAGRVSGMYQPRSAELSKKFGSVPRAPPSPSLPTLRVFHRSSGQSLD